MKILVDADACPVKQIIEEVAIELCIPVIMIIDTSHELYSNYSEILQVSQGKDAVDLALINRCDKGDIVVSQDYGVATMVLGKQAFAINQNGLIYTDSNIDLLMFERHMSQKRRKAGLKICSIKKRTKEDNERFRSAFIYLCNKAIENAQHNHEEC